MKNPKTIISAKIKAVFIVIFVTIFTPFFTTLHAQEAKPSIAVPDFDTRDYDLNNAESIQYVINELIRIGKYEVMDRYDIEYIALKDSLNTKGCFSNMCLKETGAKLNVDKMFTGSIQRLGDKINVMLRMLDVASGTLEKQVVKEFLNIKGNELTMIRITINEMFALPNDEDMVRKLTLRADYDNSVNNPYELLLKADGPRMGIGFLTGVNAQVMRNPTSQGGFDANPFMFQFGYQFEKQYLNEGNFQALFEFVPMISGMDQGRFIPSFTFLNGLRNNKNGWEFAFGPTFTFNKTAYGFVDANNQWHLAADADTMPFFKPSMEKRLDSRGTVSLNTGFLFAFGRTFKSGKMNIPVNGYIVPGKNGIRFGVSFGWNGHSRYHAQP